MLRALQICTRWAMGFAVLCILAFVNQGPAHAAAPLAGTSIGNKSTATYIDGTGVLRSVTSNQVDITILQVASLTLTAPGAQSANAGGVVYYPHTLTNTGNGSDTFNLAVANAGGFSMSGAVQIFADNGAGLPTGPAITSTGAIAANAVFKFIVVATLPTTATTGQTNNVTVTGASVLDTTKTANNIDVTTVTANAIVTLTKAVNVASGVAGSGPYKYTLKYTNTGNSTATTVAITDTIPAGMGYVAGSGRWSLTGATALSDSGATVGTAPNTLISSYTAGSKTLLFTLNQLTAGQTGTLSFDVNVVATAATGVQNNTATMSYNNGAGTANVTSNTVAFTVTPPATTALTFVGPALPTPLAAPGEVVSFINVLTNNGNSADTFNIVYSTGNFPPGTTFQLFKGDGLTPLVDTNGDFIVDSGPVAAGGVYNVVLKATLPVTASNTGAPFSVMATARSVMSPASSAVATDTLTAIIPAAVDLTNTSAAGTGTGPGPEGAAVLTTTASTSAPAVFTLVASNKGASPDNYDLAASNVSSFASIALPAGWSVSFKADGGAGNCSTTGANITNTGTVLAGASFAYCAVVTVPATGAGAAAGTTPLYFRLLSPNTGAKDIITDAVKIDVIRSLILTPTAQAAQVLAGGSTVYVHTLVNAGNVTEGGGTTSSSISLAAVNAQAGWTSALYIDTNANGVLDVADTQITGNLDTVLTATGLVPGATRTIFNKVTSSAGATAGALDTSTITLTVSAGVNGTAPAPVIAVDTTTVVVGNVTITKTQVLDAACSGLPTGYSAAVVSAKPGECVLYKITITNAGTTDALSVVVGDATPTFTKMGVAPSITVGTMAAGVPAVGASGSFSANVGTLTVGQAAVMTFGIKINQ